MRRTSFVAPLLLIAIGALFLARNIYPDMPLMDYVARFWPVALIAWGALRIIEILAWSASARPLPARGITGGEWLLVLLLCLVGTSIHAVHGITNWWPGRIQLSGDDFFGERFEYPLSADKAVGHTPHIVLEDFRGDAKITGTDGPDVVKVTGHKTIRSMEQKQADQSNDETKLEITGDANNVVIRLREEGARPARTVTGTLEIGVPKGASIEIHGRRGDLEVSDITGTVTIDSDNAGVRLKNIGGDARLDLRRSDVVHGEAVKGAVDIRGRGSEIELDGISGPVTINGVYTGMLHLKNLAKSLHFTGTQTDFSLESVPGEIRLDPGDLSASNIIGPTRLTGRSRDVRITDFTGPLEVTIERGDLNLSTAKLPLSRIQAKARSGDIHLGLPGEAQFSLTASTNNGDVSNNFGGTLHAEQNRRRGKMSGSAGSGGPSIELETERGDIVIEKAGASKNIDAKGGTPPLQKLDQ